MALLRGGLGHNAPEIPFKMRSILGFGGVLILQLVAPLADRQESLFGAFETL